MILLLYNILFFSFWGRSGKGLVLVLCINCNIVLWHMSILAITREMKMTLDT